MNPKKADEQLGKGGIDDPTYRLHRVGRKFTEPGVFFHGLLIGSDENAVQLIVGNVRLKPLNLRTHRLKDIDGCFGDGGQLLAVERTNARHIPLYDEFRHIPFKYFPWYIVTC